MPNETLHKAQLAGVAAALRLAMAGIPNLEESSFNALNSASISFVNWVREYMGLDKFVPAADPLLLELINSWHA
jgi:hypothetical protein